MNIRQAELTDWEMYKELLRAFREAEPGDLYQYRRIVEYSEGTYEDGFRYAKIFLIEIGGKVVGMGGVSYTEDGEGYLEGGTILPAYRSYGFYRSLLNQRIAFLESKGVKSIEIGTANPRVRKVINSLGFEPVRELYYIKRINVL